MTALTVAGLTLREAFRRRVVWALLVLTVALLALSGWGFSKLIGLDTELGTMTSGEARLVASVLLNLIMFGFSLIAAIGTAFLAGPTLAGEVESGQALAVLARPVRRSAVLLGKWLGLVAFGCGYVVLAGLAPGEAQLSVRVRSAGGPVAAVIQQSVTRRTIPQGICRLTGEGRELIARHCEWQRCKRTEWSLGA